MTTIDLFFQGEGLGEIKHLEIEPDATCAIFKARVSEIHGVARDVLVFLEDEDDPIADDVLLKEHGAQKGLKVHVHRCHRVEVAVTFNGETVEHRFTPAATTARIKRWPPSTSSACPRRKLANMSCKSLERTSVPYPAFTSER